MRRKQKSKAELEKQFGGFVPPGTVRGQSKRTSNVAYPSQPTPEPVAESVVAPEVTSEPIPTEKGKT